MPRANSPYDRDWFKLRAKFLRAFPTCRVCSAPSHHVDHIVTIRQAPERRLDWGNLQALCATHHMQLTQAFDNPTIRQGCDVNGRPLDPKHPWASDPGQKTRGKQDWVRQALGERRGQEYFGEYFGGRNFPPKIR